MPNWVFVLLRFIEASYPRKVYPFGSSFVISEDDLKSHGKLPEWDMYSKNDSNFNS